MPARSQPPETATKKLLSVSQAAKYLKVSPKTLRRWDQKGILESLRTIGNQRRYQREDLEKFKSRQKFTKGKTQGKFLTIGQAARQLKVSPKTLRRWDQKGILTTFRTTGNQRRYRQKEILAITPQEKIFFKKTAPLSNELEKVLSKVSVKPSSKANFLSLTLFLLFFLIALAGSFAFAGNWLENFGQRIDQRIDHWLASLDDKLLGLRLIPDDKPEVAGIQDSKGKLAIALPNTQNMFTNASFESALEGVSVGGQGEEKYGQPWHWHYLESAHKGNLYVTNEAVRSGTLAIKAWDSGFDQPTTNNQQLTTNLGLSQPEAATEAGREYILSVFIKTKELKGSPKLILGFLSSAGAQAGDSDQSTSSTSNLQSTGQNQSSSWQKFSFHLQASQAGQYPFIKITNYQGGIIYLDDVTLYETQAFYVDAVDSSSSSLTLDLPTSNLTVADGALITDHAGHLYPKDPERTSLGMDGERFSDLYAQRTDINDRLRVGGAVSLEKNLSVQGAATVSGNLLVQGKTTFTETITFQNGTSFSNLTSHLLPNTDDTYDLGSSSLEWQDLYLDGTAYLDTADINTLTTDSLQLTTSPVAGYVLTSNASGNASWTDVSSSAGPWTLVGTNLYPDSTTYNLGIGTTSPSTALEVVGAITASNGLTVSAGTVSLPSGEIGNTELANSSLSYGGVSLSLGGTDATPAFDLTDATSLPIINGTTGTLTVARGGTGLTTLTDHGLLVGSGTAAVTSLAVATDGQVLIGSTAVDPSWGTIGASSVTADSLDFSELADAMTLDANTSLNLYNGTADVDLRFYNSDSTDELFFLDSSTGHVGIGTTAPPAHLFVFNETYPTLEIGTQVDAGRYVGQIQWNSTSNYLAVSSLDRATSYRPLYLNSSEARFNTGTGSVTSKMIIDVNGNVLINGFSSSTVGLIVKGAASQTANLQEWQNSAGGKLIAVSPLGGLAIGSAWSAAEPGAGNIASRGYLSIGAASVTPGSSGVLDIIDSKTGIGEGVSWRGINSVANASGSGPNWNLTSINATARDLANNTQTIANLIGIQASATIQSTATAKDAIGVRAIPSITNASGTITNAWGIKIDPSNAGTFTNYYGIELIQPGGTKTTDNIGLKIGDHSGATNNFAIVTNAGNIVFNEGGDASTDFRVEGSGVEAALFIDGTDGSVGIGTTAPGAKLSFAVGSTAAGGIDFGGDVNLYRSSANWLKTDDSISISGGYINFGENDQTIADNTDSVIVYDPDGSHSFSYFTTGDNEGLFNIVGANLDFKLSGYDNDSQVTILEAVDENANTDWTLTTDGANGVNGLTMYFRGNLGIGTTDPGEKLDVVGNITASGTITGGGAFTPGGDITMAEDAWIGLSSSTERLAFDGSGDVLSVMDSGLRIYDSTDTDYLNIAHDGTDVNLTTSGTTDINIDNDVDIAAHVAIGANASINSLHTLYSYEIFSQTSGVQRAIYGYASNNATLTGTNTVVGVSGEAYAGSTEDGNASVADGVSGIAFTTGTNTYYLLQGGAFTAYSSSTASSGQDYLFGMIGTAYLNSSGNVTYVQGGRNIAYNGSSGTIADAKGIYNYVYKSSTGNITTAFGAYNEVYNIDSTGTGAITTAYGDYNYVHKHASANDYTTVFGSRINIDAGATQYGLYLDELSSATTNAYGIYAEEGDWVLDADGNAGVGGTGPGGDLALGEGQDLVLYHDSNDSYILNKTGDLYIGDVGTDDVILSNNGGLVGIGTTDPGGKLDINTATASDIGLIIKTTDDDTTNNLTEWQNSSGSLLSGVNASGNFGIGTSPQTDKKLYAYYNMTTNGASIFQTGGGANITSGNAYGSYMTINTANTSDSTANLVGAYSKTLLNVNYNWGQIRGGYFSASVSEGITGKPTLMAGGEFITDVEDAAFASSPVISNHIYMPYVDTGSVTNAYGIYVREGVVGEGSNTNRYGLYLEELDQGTNNYGIWAKGDWVLDADGNAGIGGTGPGGDLALGEGQDLVLYHDSNDSYILNKTGDLYIGDAGTDDVILSSNGGLVGIGTTDPSQKLEVAGNMLLGSDADDNDDYLYFDTGTSQSLSWDDSPGEFDLSDDLNISGHLAVSSGTINSSYIANFYEIFTDTSGTVMGIRSIVDANPGSESSGTYRGAHLQATSSSSSNITGSLQAVNAYVANAGSGTATYGMGLNASVNNTSTGQINDARGINLRLNNSGIGTISTGAGIWVDDFTNSGGGSFNTAYGIYIDSQTVASNNYALVTNAGNIVFNEGGDADTDFRVEGDTNANLLFVDASADMVGIGTTAPSKKLTVNGDINIPQESALFLTTAATSGRVLQDSSTVVQVYGSGGFNVQTYDSAWLDRLRITAAGLVGIGTTDPQAALAFASGTTAADGILFGTDVNLYRLTTNYLRTDDNLQVGGAADVVGAVYGTLFYDRSDTNYYLDPANSTSLLVAGDVGIGTTNPSSELHIAGTTPLLTIGDAGEEDTAILFDGAAQDFHLGLDDTLDDLVIGTGSTLGDSNIITIENGGSVGIGTTDPSQELEVVGNIMVNRATFPSLHFGNTNNSLWKAGDGDLRIKVGGSDRVTFDSSGSLGVGTTNPGQELEVNGNIRLTLDGTDNTTDVCLDGDGDLTDCGASSLRYKENITDLGYGLGELLGLRPVTFTYKEASNNRLNLGFIAEEVETLVPELVAYKDGLPQRVLYENLTALLTKGVQEQQISLESQASRINQIEASFKETPSGPDPDYDLLDQRLTLLEEIILAQEATSSANSSDPGSKSADDPGSSETILTDLSEDLSPEDLSFNQNLIAEKNLTVMGKTILADLGLTGQITTGLLVIDGLSASDGASLYTLSGPLKLQELALGNLEIMAGQIIFDTEGNLKVEGTITAEKLTTETIAIGGSSSGSGLLPAGETSVEIEAAVTSQSDKVLITPTTLVDKPLVITYKEEGRFRVEITAPFDKEISFDWLVIQKKDERAELP